MGQLERSVDGIRIEHTANDFVVPALPRHLETALEARARNCLVPSDVPEIAVYHRDTMKWVWLRDEFFEKTGTSD